jgi:hypothetical protein
VKSVWIIVREESVTLGHGSQGVHDVLAKIGADAYGEGGTPHPAFMDEAAAEAYIESQGLVYSRALEVEVRDAESRPPLAALPVRFYANGQEFALRSIGVESEPEYIDIGEPRLFSINGPRTLVVEFLDRATALEFAAIAGRASVAWRLDFANAKSRAGSGIFTMVGNVARVQDPPLSPIP